MAPNPSHFYKCPHCGHVILKDSTAMMLAGTGAPFDIAGGGCPDCRQHLDAEKVYVTCEYDLSIAEIARGNYGRDVINNILASHRLGKIHLTPVELNLLAPVPPAKRKPGRKYLWLLLPIIPIIAAVLLWPSLNRQTPDKFGMPPGIKASVLDSAASGSTIISVQNVQKDGLDLWCVVTIREGELTRWVASETGSPSADTGNPSAFLLQDAGWENFSKVGCTNWSEEQLTQAVSAATAVPQASPTAAGFADFNVPVYGLVLTYPTDQWQVSADGKALEWITQPGCRIYTPDSIYSTAEIAPQQKPDSVVTLGNTEFNVYNYLHMQDSIAGALYRSSDGINKEVSGNTPVIIYIEWQSQVDYMGDCQWRAQVLLDTIRVQP